MCRQRNPEAHRRGRRDRQQRRRGAADARRQRLRLRVHGLPDAGNGRVRGDAAHPRRCPLRGTAGRRADRQRTVRRPRGLPRCRHERLPDQAVHAGAAREHARQVDRP